MVGTAPPPPTTALQQKTSAASSSSTGSAAAAATTAAATLSSAEEEAYKRNTDCVYFLASPLTCKKGSECEYRHSDIARVNPRDCWYWMHGNCLNPKCAFRHPPLDGLLGTQVPNTMGASAPPSQAATTPAAPAPYASGKQAVPCIFFQKGLCLKGDWCQFSHALNSVSNKVLQGQAATTATEPPNFKQTFGGHEKFTQEKKVPQTNITKSIQLPQAKPVAKFESAPAKSEISIKKIIPPASTIDDEPHRNRLADISPAGNENQVSWSNRVQQPVSLNDHTSINGKDVEEFSREPSPGFDVLVDDELRDSDYFGSEEQFGRAGNSKGRNEYYDGRSGDYSSMVDTDQDVYHESRGYDSYEQLQSHYAWEQRRSSSERMSGGSAHPERRRYSKGGSPDQVDESDLRHHLSKHRRANGLRSVINQDYGRERLDDRGYKNLKRDSRHDRERQDSSLSSRLRGRIKIPVRSSSSADGNDLHQDREIERRRDHSGLSQGRLQLSSRLRDRVKGKMEEDINNEGRNNRGLRIRSDTITDDNAGFTGPKSLAELRGRKNIGSNDQQSPAKRKYSKVEYQPHTGGELSFDGPKPLEEILKRKRGSGTAVSGSGTTSGDNGDYTSKKREESSMKTKAGAETAHSSPSMNDLDFHNSAYNSASAVKSRSERALSYDDQSSHPHNANEAEVEEGMIVDDGAEDQEPETYDHGDEDSDYEQGDGEDYNLDEADNGNPEEEYLDDDDDFAKKLGVM